METIDVQLLEYFGPIFLLIFIWVVLYAFLTKTKYITDNSNFNSIIALVLALISLQATTFSAFVVGLIPFFVFGVFVIFVFTFLFTSAGVTNFEKMKTPGITWTLIIIGLLIALWVGGNTWGGHLLNVGEESEGLIGERPTNTEDLQTNIVNSIFNPKVAGSLLFLGFIAIAIILIIE